VLLKPDPIAPSMARWSDRFRWKDFHDKNDTSCFDDNHSGSRPEQPQFCSRTGITGTMDFYESFNGATNSAGKSWNWTPASATTWANVLKSAEAFPCISFEVRPVRLRRRPACNLWNHGRDRGDPGSGQWPWIFKLDRAVQSVRHFFRSRVQPQCPVRVRFRIFLARLQRHFANTQQTVDAVVLRRFHSSVATRLFGCVRPPKCCRRALLPNWDS